MIGRITGHLLSKQAPDVLVDVGGVGYELQVPMSTYYQLPETGSDVVLIVHHVVREDAQLLFGFAAERDRELFRHLIRVNGVGPKLALAILSGLDSDSFARVVHAGDLASLVALPGVGKKTAERLLIEMRDRMKDWGTPTGEPQQHAEAAPAADHMADAESALIALGYRPAEAARLVAAVAEDGVEDSEELIRLALRSTVKEGGRK